MLHCDARVSAFSALTPVLYEWARNLPVYVFTEAHRHFILALVMHQCLCLVYLLFHPWLGMHPLCLISPCVCGVVSRDPLW